MRTSALTQQFSDPLMQSVESTPFPQRLGQLVWSYVDVCERAPIFIFTKFISKQSVRTFVLSLFPYLFPIYAIHPNPTCDLLLSHTPRIKELMKVSPSLRRAGFTTHRWPNRCRMATMGAHGPPKRYPFPRSGFPRSRPLQALATRTVG